MTDNEIIIQAIRKAISNGCKYSTYDIDVHLWLKHRLYFSVIFDHDFAKAFWGEKWCDINMAHNISIPENPVWKFHLQQMVLEPEPFKYLEKFL